ncbi:MAG TPA: Rieske 2Fe-2S domain-containing protein [Alphaproteobacteria bacterium]|nr:Rieske 2Fe-2S domain-containing protein [Alphaproteobacteria bacterium]
MITAAENEMISRVGRGTPMGELMRQFWIPACLSSELKPDDTPMRLMLLGEKLIAFRDSSGRVGIFDHRCPHRCASLFQGRNEGNGLRCVYHGWKFDVEGNCLEQPNLPENRRFEDKVKAHAYKTQESGGMVFVYMGKRAVPPPLPEFECVLAKGDDRNIALTHRECNWLQALDGDVDTSHLGFLHAGCIDGSRMDPNDAATYTVINKAPEVYATERPYGTIYSASRPAMPGFDHHRFAAFIFPFWVTYPSDRLEKNASINAWVPIDDYNTMIFNIDLQRASGRFKRMTYADGTPVPGLARPLNYLPRTTDWMGRWRAAANPRNDHNVDREMQKRGESFSGIIGIPLQDQAVQEAMDPIVDRSMETVASSDLMVVLTRRVMLRAVREYQATGKLPAVLDDTAMCRNIRGGDVITPSGTNWLAAYDSAIATIFGSSARTAAE